MSEASTTGLANLVARLQAGDAAARRELVARSIERLRRLTRRLLDDFPRVRRWEQEDDVLQNATLRLLRSLEAVTPTSVSGFLTLAAREIRRELLDLARHYYGPEGLGAAHATIAPAESNAPSLGPPQSTHDPLRLAAWTDFHRHVERLPPEEREVFDLLWYHELTQEDAAVALDISLATLKRRWMAARLRLQQSLHDLPGTA